MIKKGQVITLLALVTIIIISVLIASSNVKAAALTVLVIALIITISAYKHSVVLFAFMISYMFFLVGPFSLNVWLAKNLSFISSIRGYETLITTSLIIGMLSVYLGYILTNNGVNYRSNRSINESGSYLKQDKIDTKLLFNIAKVAFYISAVCTLWVCVEKAMFYIRYGYSAYHAGLSIIYSGIPTIVSKLASGLDLFAIICFATMQERKKYKWIFITYIASGAFELFFGVRTGVVISIIIVYTYIRLRGREFKDPGYHNRAMLGKSLKKIGLSILIISFAVFLVIYGYTRSNVSNDRITTNDIVFQLVAGSSDTVNLFALAEKTNIGSYSSSLFSFGDFNLWVTDSLIGQVILHRPYLNSHTVQMAESYYSLGQSVAYHAMKTSYLSGSAYGSSYIVENYVDGGYFGIFLGSLFYGVLIKLIENFKSKKIFGRTLLLLLISRLIYAPRAGFSGIIVELLSFTYLMYVAIIIFIYMMLSTKSVRRRKKST